MSKNLSEGAAKAAQDLVTVRDFLRYAVSCFNQAELAYGHGTVNALDEAAFVILESLKLPVDQLEPWLDAKLLAHEREALSALIEARVKLRKPAAYLLGKTYIQGVPFYVDERVIIPRSFIGEIIGGQTDFRIEEMLPHANTILDLCTGSGCLAILAAGLYEDAQIDAADLSKDALEVAAKNLALHKLEGRVKLHHGNLFGAVKGKRYDLIITNPPYVRPEIVDSFPPEHASEPRMAHDGFGDGLDLVRQILRDAPSHLNPGGGIICEIGTDREILEEEFPDLPFMWLDTEHSRGEVFFLFAGDFDPN